jgi:hypothetical protein
MAGNVAAQGLAVQGGAATLSAVLADHADFDDVAIRKNHGN